MKTNHRTSDVKRRDHTCGYRGNVAPNVKAEARKGRRNADRSTINAIRTGVDPDDVQVWTKNLHVSDVWNWD